MVAFDDISTGGTENMDQNCQVALACDARMLDAALVVAGSVFENCTRPVQLYFMGVGLTASDQTRVQRFCEAYGQKLTYIDVTPDRFNGAVQKDPNISLVTLARLFLPSFVTGKVLYLDCDLLVHDDVSKMFDADLGGALVGAVRDNLMISKLSRSRVSSQSDLEYFTNIKAPKDASDYFNAGVLLMDCDRIRADHDLFARLTDWPSLNQYRFFDQDHLNILFSEKTYYFPLRWNLAWGEARRVAKQVDNISGFPNADCADLNVAAISHFTGGYKPWMRITADMILRGRLRTILSYRAAARRILSMK
jgi:lipopolysaccharide biosynthesis glycosyltransferase